MDGEQINRGNEGSAGPVIGIIIILAVIVLGGLYFWGQRTNETAQEEDNLAAELDEIGNQSSSDEVTAIEADLQSTDIESLDAELNASN
jgi:uncharacterized protein HemX